MGSGGGAKSAPQPQSERNEAPPAQPSAERRPATSGSAEASAVKEQPQPPASAAGPGTTSYTNAIAGDDGRRGAIAEANATAEFSKNVAPERDAEEEARGMAVEAARSVCDAPLVDGAATDPLRNPMPELAIEHYGADSPYAGATSAEPNAALGAQPSVNRRG